MNTKQRALGVVGILLLGVGGGEPHEPSDLAQVKAPAAATPAVITAPAPTATATTEPTKPGQPYRFGEVQALAPPTVDGMAPVVRRIPTDKPYVFITIDDGGPENAAARDLIVSSGAMPTMFLANKFVVSRLDFYRSIQDRTGVPVQNHTINHPNLRGRRYESQRAEICGNADAQAAEFGHRPTLFRPPYGNHDVDTRKAAADCGMKAIVLWSAEVRQGAVQFQLGNHLNPGDIVLMHFGPSCHVDYQAFLERAHRDGLTPVPLTDFLG